MTPGQMRSELLAQHAEMRGMIERARGLTARLRAGEAVRVELQAALGLLADATRAHNEREESLLREVIPTVDAWGPARADVMVEQHGLEHQALHDALRGAATGDDVAAVCEATEALLARIVQHMEREEEAFLSEEVLRDDGVNIYYFGG